MWIILRLKVKILWYIYTVYIMWCFIIYFIILYILFVSFNISFASFCYHKSITNIILDFLTNKKHIAYTHYRCIKHEIYKYLTFHVFSFTLIWLLNRICMQANSVTRNFFSASLASFNNNVHAFHYSNLIQFVRFRS